MSSRFIGNIFDNQWHILLFWDGCFVPATAITAKHEIFENPNAN